MCSAPAATMTRTCVKFFFYRQIRGAPAGTKVVLLPPETCQRRCGFGGVRAALALQGPWLDAIDKMRTRSPGWRRGRSPWRARGTRFASHDARLIRLILLSVCSWGHCRTGTELAELSPHRLLPVGQRPASHRRRPEIRRVATCGLSCRLFQFFSFFSFSIPPSVSPSCSP